MPQKRAVPSHDMDGDYHHVEALKTDHFHQQRLQNLEHGGYQWGVEQIMLFLMPLFRDQTTCPRSSSPLNAIVKYTRILNLSLHIARYDTTAHTLPADYYYQKRTTKHRHAYPLGKTNRHSPSPTT